ncbi:YqiA/YcfP family alpha/beta fold hydrolase [Zunongwangia sp. H14]|uniref:YqiA/YcfP family alpha/beta fold hydrolase n=1 Tax=Zunongwangia sp. H14 TaxID=3240792 RepID=UPI0035680E71
MNILYLHGLKSKLSSAKRKVLEQYGNVYAPDIDYSRDHIQYGEVLQQFPKTEFNVIIGSSMGALNAYIISNWIGRPALLFNPPLSKHPWSTMFPKEKFSRGDASKQLLLGARDEVVNPQETLSYIGNHLYNHELVIKIDPQLGHRIPVDVFKAEVKDFFDKICQ